MPNLYVVVTVSLFLLLPAAPAHAIYSGYPIVLPACGGVVETQCTRGDGGTHVLLPVPGHFGVNPGTFSISVDGHEIYRSVSVASSDGDAAVVEGGDARTGADFGFGDHDVLVNDRGALCRVTVRVITGPACDRDRDGTRDAIDNCPDVPNYYQTDADHDGRGDECDDDDDGDGCADAEDEHPLQSMGRIGARQSSGAAFPCPGDDGYVYLFDGSDSDGDGLRNCVDPDDDNDGVPDTKDWCPVDPIELGADYCYQIYPPLICIVPEHEPCAPGIGCDGSLDLELASNPEVGPQPPLEAPLPDKLVR